VLVDNDDESLDDIREIQLTSSSGEMVKASVEESIEDMDLVVMKTERALEPRLHGISEKIPPIGRDCFWCGYPMLIGEGSPRRVRYGWGKISSLPYGSNTGIFEVDGNFSPAHSGSPIVDATSNLIIGVVSRSVGDPRNHFRKYRRYIEALRFIAPHLNLPSQLLESIKNTVNPRQQYQLPGDSMEFMVEGEVSPESTGITKSIIDTLKEVGMDVREYSYHNLRAMHDPEAPKSIPASKIIGFDSMMQGVINLILMITDSVESAINETYQMGIGIASGGEALFDLCNSYS
jgi:hypothetical protein